MTGFHLAKIMELVQKLQDLIWGPPLMLLLLGTGFYLMVSLKGIPLRKLPRAISETLHFVPVENASVFSSRNTSSKKSKEGGEISAFSSLSTELAATIGTGNIVGVVSAIMLGGPGALWWMLFSGILGLATKLVESSISVKYRVTGKNGEYHGGPMITLAGAGFPYPRLGKALALMYAVFAILCAFGMGNMVQANSIAASLECSFGISNKISGWVLAVLILFAVLGGVRVISGISAFLVPAMGALYLAGCLGVMYVHRDQLIWSVFGSLAAAFYPKAVSGGIFGTITATFLESAKWGVSRGIFSNEAGLGAAGISAAASEEKDAIRQGMISMTGVFFDTMIICMVTGVTFCCSGVMQKASAGKLFLNGKKIMPDDGVGLMIAAFETAFGSYGTVLLGICITLFAFATILGWGYQGEQAFRYLFGERQIPVFRFAYGFASFLGAVLTLRLVWGISDICNGLLSIPNLICVLVLSGRMCKEIREYFHF